MKKETWIELIVGIVILGGLGYLSSRVTDMSQLLGSVDSKVSLTSERLDRIAQALPDVGVRIAYEEVRKPIRTVVITSTPVTKANGSIVATVSVFDLAENKAWTKPVVLTSMQDKQMIGALAWSAAEMDPQYASIARMQEYSQTVKADSPIPAFINPSTSFILRNVSGEKLLEQAPWLEASPTDDFVKLDGGNWQLLASSLKEGEERLQSPQPQ
ncbi:MAG: hypothetical protein ACOY3E_00645 [Pseudomonadota bacterium]